MPTVRKEPMMVYLKIIAILLSTGAGLLQIGLEHKWHDKRKTTYKKVRSTLVVLMIIGFIAASSLVLYDEKQSEIQIDKLTELNTKEEKSRKEAEDRELDAIEDRQRIKNELEALQMQIKPVIKLATEKYPTLDLNSALVKIADEVQTLKVTNEDLQKKTKELAERDYFRPLNTKLKGIVIERLHRILTSFNDRNIQISVISELGNTNRQKVAIQLVEILALGGFKATGPTPAMTAAKGILPPVQVIINPADEDIGRQLAEALNVYLKVIFSGRGNNESERGNIKIMIYGEPIFSDDGVATFP